MAKSAKTVKTPKLRKIRRCNGWDIAIHAALIIFALLAIYPVIYTLAGSLSDGEDYSYGGIWIVPRKFTFDNYQVVLKDMLFWTSLGNTVLKTVVGTLTGLLFTSFVSYAMSRPNLPFKKFFRTANLITMFFSGGLIPYYLVINLIGLYNSWLVYIIPSLYSVYNMIVISSYFKNSIPEEIHESAVMDGAREIGIWFRFYLPLAKPVLATVGLWIAVGHWNSYMQTLMYTARSENMWTLQYYLMRVIQDSVIPEGGGAESITPQTITFATMILSILPIVCVYPLLQRYFSKGVVVGSLKG